MDNIIIDNKTDLSMIDSLFLIQEVLKIGRVCNMAKEYVHVISFKRNGKKYFVHSYLNDKSDKFLIV